MYSLLREYPWLRPYWYAALALLALLGVAMILWDGKTQVDKGRRVAAKKQERLRAEWLARRAGAADTAVRVGTDNAEEMDGGSGAQQRRPPRKTVS